MKNTHRSTQLMGRAALVALLAAPALGAQGPWDDRGDRGSRGGRRDEVRRLFAWRGTVDNDVRIYMRGAAIQSRVLRGETSRGRIRVERDNALPRRDGVVRVQLVEGRGRVYVIQQPSASNDYTAILRVADWQGGADQYRFVAYFDPTDRVWSDDRDSRGTYDPRDRRTVWGGIGGEVDLRNRVLRWTGSVDGDLRIALRDGQVNYQIASGARPQNVQSSVGRTQAPRDGHLTVSLREGRGSVFIVEQPSAFNNYTTLVRVVDPQGGYGYYDFDLVWQ